MSFTDKKANFQDNSFTDINEALKDASKKVIELNGKERQFFKAIEESVELNDSIFKFMKGKASREDVLSEVADNEILGSQIKEMLECSDEEFASIKKEKINKLRAFLGLSALIVALGYFIWF